MLPVLGAIDSIISMFDPENWFRQVPEGMEFLGAAFTIAGSLAIMVVLGKWWER